MKIINTYKKNIKLILIVILLITMSFINSLEGFVYAQNGFCYTLVGLEFLSLLLTLFLINIVWCMYDDGKCATFKKH